MRPLYHLFILLEVSMLETKYDAKAVEEGKYKTWIEKGYFECGDMSKLFSKDEAIEDLEKGKVIFLAGGTGHPYFSTDMGIVLKAVEIEAGDTDEIVEVMKENLRDKLDDSLLEAKINETLINYIQAYEKDEEPEEEANA